LDVVEGGVRRGQRKKGYELLIKKPNSPFCPSNRNGKEKLIAERSYDGPAWKRGERVRCQKSSALLARRKKGEAAPETGS